MLDIHINSRGINSFVLVVSIGGTALLDSILSTLSLPSIF